MNVEQYIKELLFSNTMVIIPDFGTLITEYESAIIDTKKNQISPPRKVISFDNNKLTSDGLLVNYIAAQADITTTEAKDKVFRFVTEAFVKLEQGNKVVIDEVGIFSFDKKRKLNFTVFEDSNFLADTFGMSDLKIGSPVADKTVKKAAGTKSVSTDTGSSKIITTKTVTTTTKTSTVAAKNSSKEEVVKKKKSKAWVFIFLLLILVGAGTFIVLKTDWLNSAKTFIVGKTPTSEEIVDVDHTMDLNVDQNQTQTQTNSDQVNDVGSQAVGSDGLDDPAKVHSKEEATEYVEPKIKADSKKTFHIIAGSYSAYDAAKQTCQRFKSKGYESEVLEKENGVYRVTLGSYKYKNKAMQDLEKFKQAEGLSVDSQSLSLHIHKIALNYIL